MASIFKIGEVSATDNKTSDGKTSLYGLTVTLKPDFLSNQKPVTVPVNSFIATSKEDRDAAKAAFEEAKGREVNVIVYNIAKPFTVKKANGDTVEYKGMTLVNWWLVGTDRPSAKELNTQTLNQYCKLTGESITNYDKLPEIIRFVTFGSSAIAAAAVQTVGMPEEQEA
jgi:hypothetical protein